MSDVREFEMPIPAVYSDHGVPGWSEETVQAAYTRGREDFKEAVRALLVELHAPNVNRHNDYLVALNNVEKLI